LPFEKTTLFCLTIIIVVGINLLSIILFIFARWNINSIHKLFIDSGMSMQLSYK